MVLRLTLCDRLGRVPWELSITDSFLQFANLSRVQQSLSSMRKRKYFMFRRASGVTGNVSIEHHIIYSCKNNSGHCHQKIRNLVFGNALDKRYKSFIQSVALSVFPWKNNGNLSKPQKYFHFEKRIWHFKYQITFLFLQPRRGNLGVFSHGTY